MIEGKHWVNGSEEVKSLDASGREGGKFKSAFALIMQMAWQKRGSLFPKSKRTKNIPTVPLQRRLSNLSVNVYPSLKRANKTAGDKQKGRLAENRIGGKLPTRLFPCIRGAVPDSILRRIIPSCRVSGKGWWRQITGLMKFEEINSFMDTSKLRFLDEATIVIKSHYLVKPCRYWGVNFLQGTQNCIVASCVFTFSRY